MSNIRSQKCQNTRKIQGRNHLRIGKQLDLGYCIDDSISQDEVKLSDEEKISKITSGRKLLYEMTGKDFGFDLARWRNFLINDDENDEFGYNHPYAFENVDKEIQRSISDTSRERLIAEIRKRGLDTL